MSYEIRPPRADEIAALPAIERDAARRFAPLGMEALMAAVLTSAEAHEEARRAGRSWVAAPVGGAPVGFAVASLHDDRAHLDELDVLDAHGRRGLGRRLVEAVEAWARAQGARALTLSTMRDVPWNGPWYARLGFAVVEPRDYDAALRALAAHEAEMGLPMAGRVIMRKVLG